MKDYSLIENHFGIQIPAQIKMIHDYQDINNVKIFHRNFVGRYMYKFEFLSLNDLDESLCILPDDTDYSDGENVFHIPILVKQKQNEYVEFDKHIFRNEVLVPIARDIDGDQNMYLFFSNLRENIFGIHLDCEGEFYEIAPSIDYLIPIINNELQIEGTDELTLKNWKIIQDYYDNQEKNKYGNFFIYDGEAFDELESYKLFINELLSFFYKDKFVLSKFETNTICKSLNFVIDDVEINCNIVIDGWMDFTILTCLNDYLSTKLEGKKLVIIEDSKYTTQEIKIALV